jgi:hypothetical protein
MKRTLGILLGLIPAATILGSAIAQAADGWADATIAFDVGAGETRKGTHLCGTYRLCGKVTARARIYDNVLDGHYCDSFGLTNGENVTLGTTQTFHCTVDKIPPVGTKAMLYHDLACTIDPILATGNLAAWPNTSIADTTTNSNPLLRYFSVDEATDCSSPGTSSFRSASWGVSYGRLN